MTLMYKQIRIVEVDSKTLKNRDCFKLSLRYVGGIIMQIIYLFYI